MSNYMGICPECKEAMNCYDMGAEYYNRTGIDYIYTCTSCGYDTTPKETESRGTLKVGEPHPAAIGAALAYYNSLSFEDISGWTFAFANCAIEDNRLAEVCLETLNRLRNGEKVSDRYFLGLVWTMRCGESK